MNELKHFSIAVAILCGVLLICSIGVFVFPENATYLIKQDDIPKIQLIKGVNITVIDIKDSEFCDNVKVVKLEMDYYFGGKFFTNLGYELQEAGITYQPVFRYLNCGATWS
jgi:hypothetical protein